MFYKIAALKPSEFADKPEILKKYFRNNNRPLDRAHIPYAWTSKSEVQRKVAADFGTAPQFIDLTDYIRDEDFYLLPDFYDNMYYCDEKFREQDDQPVPEPNRLAFSQDVERCYNSLWHFCAAAIRSRKAMLLGCVLECLRLLNVVNADTNGFSQNIRQSLLNAMRSYERKFTTLLTNKEVREFIQTHSDIDVFASDDATRSDYVQTYKALGTALTGVPQEELRSVSDIYGTLDPVLNAALDVVDVELVEEACKKDFDKLESEEDEEEDEEDSAEEC